MKKLISILMAVIFMLAAVAVNASASTAVRPDSSDSGNYEYSLPVTNIKVINNDTKAAEQWNLKNIGSLSLHEGDIVYIPVKYNNKNITKLDTLENRNIQLKYTASGTQYFNGPQFALFEDRVYVKLEVLIPVATANTYALYDFGIQLVDKSEAGSPVAVSSKASIKGKVYSDAVSGGTIDVEDDVIRVSKGTVFTIEKDFDGAVTFEFNQGVQYKVNIKGKGSTYTNKKGEEKERGLSKIYLNMITKTDNAVKEAFADTGAKIKYYNFAGDDDGFNGSGILTIPADKGTFVYEIKDGTLKALDSTYAAGSGHSIKTNRLGYYIVSDKELKAGTSIG